MAHQDPISDLLTCLRNGARARKRFVDLKLSRQKREILRVIQEQGFIEHVLVDEELRKMRVFFRYGSAREPVLQDLKRISKPSLRKYVAHGKIPVISGGMGIAILSTSQGILEGEAARQQRVGGELLCYVW